MHHAVSTSASAEIRGRWYDRLGVGAAALCAVHCALLPVTIALLPALGLGILASHAFEVVFLFLSTTFAILSVGHSLRHHGRFHAWGLLVAGLGILYLERLVPAIHEQPVPHAMAMSVGGLLVALAHWVNLRRAHDGRPCVHPHEHGDDAPDAHAHPHRH